MSQIPETPEQTVRLLQIISGALVLGVLLMAGIAVVALGSLEAPPQGTVISGLGAGFAVVAFVLHLVVPSVAARQQARSGGERQLYGAYVTKTILGLSLLEGAAFMNLVALMVEHNWWSLAIAGGLVFWMLTMFPTTTRVEDWVETQQWLNQTDG
jgi:hypothetical protein